MLTTGTQNLPEPLAQAQAAYHDGTARLAPASADRLARRVEHFAIVEDVHSICGRTAKQSALHLGRPSGDGPADPVGRALITALLDPARVPEPDVSVPFELWVMRRMTVGLARWVGPAGGAPSPPDGGRSP